jgi:hypothetical protein
MKLAKNQTVYHNNKKYTDEIPDDIARLLGLDKQAKEPKKEQPKPKQ